VLHGQRKISEKKIKGREGKRGGEKRRRFFVITWIV